MPKPKPKPGSRARKPRNALVRSSKKGAPVVYDPLAHAEYVTGFRKRKNARRLEAQAKAAEAEKEKRREFRRDKREFIRESAQRMRGIPVDEEGSDKDAEPTVEETYDDGDTVVTAIVSKIDTSADTSFIKSTITGERRTFSRRNPLPKEVSTARLAASVVESLKGKKGGSSGSGGRGIQKPQRRKRTTQKGAKS